MRDKDIHKLIEQENPEAKQRMWERVSAELGLNDIPQQKAVKRRQPLKWALIAATIICVVTLSIVLPIMLRDDGARFCDSTQYTTASSDQTIGEYSALNNNKFIYTDWYENADEIITDYAYLNNNKNDIIFFTETIVNGETGEVLKQSVTDNKTRVDIFDRYLNSDSNTKTTINGISVQWHNSYTNAVAVFEYKNNVYYLELEGTQERLTEIITDMLK